MAELTATEFKGFTGIDINSPAELMPPSKLRRAFGIDLSREDGAITIRRGQAKVNSSAVSIWKALQGYTCSGDEAHITIPAWRFTIAAADAAKSFCTQPWEQDIVEAATTFRTGQVVGIFAWEQQNHGATNIPATSDVLGVFRSQGIRYQKIGKSLYKDGAEWWTNFSANRGQFAAYRPLSEPSTIWTFLADASQMMKTSGTSVYAWSIAAPATAPTVAAGSGTGLTGVYSLRYTYVRKSSGGVVLQESNPSPVSANVTLSNKDIAVSALVNPADPQVTHLRLYRTLAGGSVYLFDQDVAVGPLTATSSQADSLLGAAIETDNGAVPLASLSAIHYEHLFLDGDVSNPGYLWFSKKFRPWHVPATQFLEMSADDPGRAIVSWAGILIRFTRDTKYRILGVDANSFYPVEAVSRRGILTGKAWATSEHGVWYAANDGVFLTNGVMDTWVSRDVDPIFRGRTVDGHPPLNKSGNHVMEFFKGRLYLFYASGSNTEPDYMARYDLKEEGGFAPARSFARAPAGEGWLIEPLAARSMFFEHDTDLLVRGGSDGFWYQMEQETTDDAGANISIDVLTAEAAGAGPDTYKQFRRADVDIDTKGDTVTLALYLDGTAADSISLSASARSLQRPRFSSGRLGQRGQLGFTYAGTKDIRIGRAKLHHVQLGAA